MIVENNVVNFEIIVLAIPPGADVEDEELQNDLHASWHAHVPSAHGVIAVHVGVQRRGESAAVIEYTTAATSTWANAFYYFSAVSQLESNRRSILSRSIYLRA